MCGIAGIWNYSIEIKPNTLEKFTNSMRHRGPDGIGFYFDKDFNIAFGHRRLAILDLSEKGNQPMSFASERYWITYNGEIFNFIELRQELEGFGYKFHTQTDTEVILAAYHKWGDDCQHRFNGMWAFVIWDNEKKTLFLSRDRFGIKPLYYLHLPGEMFAFASETIAFSHLDIYKRKFDEANVSRVLEDVFCLEGSGHTIFKDIFQLLPGHSMVVSKKNGISHKRWWSTLEHLHEIPESYEEQVDKFKELFTDACKLRMRSDVPLASALSGGVDSSAVHCMLHYIMDEDFSDRVPKDWKKAFIATFPGTQIDEKNFASEVIQYVNGEATYISPDYSNLIEKIESQILDMDYIYLTPPVAENIYETMRNENIKVSMDGHGVDEMLLGYPDLVIDAYITAMQTGCCDYAKEILDIFISLHAPESQGDARSLFLNYPPITIYNILPCYLIRCTPNPIKYVQLYKNIQYKYKYIKQFFRILSKKENTNWLLHPESPNFHSSVSDDESLAKLSGIDMSLYTNFHKTTLPTILRNFDRASMHSGVEIRMPFMDWRLVTYVFSLPLKSKIGGGYTKRILRDAMINLMPESIRTRKQKIGLNAPMIEWFNESLSEYIKTEINSDAFLQSTIWNGPVIRDFAEDKIKNKSWTWVDCTRFWPYLNMHILMNKRSEIID